METSSSLGFYVMGGLMAASILAGLLVFVYVKPERKPAEDWIDHPSRFRRWCYRVTTFIACFLLPFSIVMLLLSILDRIDAFNDWSEGLSRAAHLMLAVIPTIALWVWFYLGLLREFRRGKPGSG